jgi:glyoxalase family protein
MTILGFHHITLICADAQRTVEFYTDVLGLRLVKRTVNFDEPDTYHLYFGDSTGRPGTVVTFFEWPCGQSGRAGIGGTHHLALATRDQASLELWRQRLIQAGLMVEGPRDHAEGRAIRFRDPDGVILEIISMEPSPPIAAEIPPNGRKEPVVDITARMKLELGIQHITCISSNLERTDAFWSGLLGMDRISEEGGKDGEPRHWAWRDAEGRTSSRVSYLEGKPEKEQHVGIGVGQTHHFAMAVADEAIQAAWRERILRAGLPVSPVMDRVYFKSIYTRDPDGHVIELATLGPGFLVDEEADELGRSLMLPLWLEPRRSGIESSLKPVNVHDGTPQAAPG